MQKVPFRDTQNVRSTTKAIFRLIPPTFPEGTINIKDVLLLQQNNLVLLTMKTVFMDR